MTPRSFIWIDDSPSSRPSSWKGGRSFSAEDRRAGTSSSACVTMAPLKRRSVPSNWPSLTGRKIASVRRTYSGRFVVMPIRLFPGMEKLFRIRVSRDNVVGREVEQLTNSELRALGKTLSDSYPEMTVIPILVVPWSKHSSEQETKDYYSAKHALVSEHLSSQFVDRKHLDDRNTFKWSVSNIGLGLFAKMGGVPWLVKPSTENCLIVGIKQAHRIVDGNVERYIAYSVLSDSSGQYEAIRVLGDTHNQKQYLANLRANLKVVLTEHAGKFTSFVIHVTFSMKRDEINTIVDMLRELDDQEGNSHEFYSREVQRP
jgi:hypothetical protein